MAKIRAEIAAAQAAAALSRAEASSYLSSSDLGRQGSHAGITGSGNSHGTGQERERSQSWSGEEKDEESRSSSRGSSGRASSRFSWSASGSSSDGGIRRLVKAGGELLSSVPQRDYEDISSHVLKSSSPVAVALRRGI